jgi:hypothetical protein
VKPLIKCELVYNNSAHLQQLYAGFAKLKTLGIIDLAVANNARATRESNAPLLFVTVDDKHKVIYDALDGFNWVPGSIEENLTFFQAQFSADYYFKRSFNQRLVNAAPLGCKVRPLGLNYHVRPNNRLIEFSVTDRLREVIRGNDLASKILGMNNDNMALPAEDYEHVPIPGKDIKILFLTRVWNPDEFKSNQTSSYIETINESRVAAVKSCRKEFGSIFCGGLTDDSFSREYEPSLIAPFSFTNKKSYLKLVKEHAICIATIGLHGSIGWKFGEYVAASRAILSDPLVYEVPGNFAKDQNYLEFRSQQELMNGIEFLLHDRLALMEMMRENYCYYNAWLKPENLVLNTLLTILEDQATTGSRTIQAARIVG